jgi:hypothetical protein
MILKWADVWEAGLFKSEFSWAISGVTEHQPGERECPVKGCTLAFEQANFDWICVLRDGDIPTKACSLFVKSRLQRPMNLPFTRGATGDWVAILPQIFAQTLVALASVPLLSCRRPSYLRD